MRCGPFMNVRHNLSIRKSMQKIYIHLWAISTGESTRLVLMIYEEMHSKLPKTIKEVNGMLRVSAITPS